MSKRIGFFVNGADSTGKLQAGQSDVNKIYSLMIDENLGNCDRELSEKHFDIKTEDDFTLKLNAILRKVKPSDQFIFYFSGHGDTSGEKYFIKLLDEEYSFKLFFASLDNKNINNAIIIVDACYSGCIAKGNPILEKELKLEETIPEGISIITSSNSYQLSHENDSTSLSVFTEVLCECIETGNGGVETTNNKITLEHVINYFENKHNNKTGQNPMHKTYNASKNIWISKNKTITINDKKQKNNLEYSDSLLEKIDIAHYHELPFTEKVDSTATVDSLNWELITEYIKNNNSGIELTLDKATILKKLKFMKHGKILNSVILNFAKSPELFIPNAYVTITVNKKNMNNIKGTVSLILKESLKFILEQLDKYSDFKSLRTDDYVIPEQLIKEALSNALVHRNYGNNCNTNIKVTISTAQQKLEITSPGNFLVDYEEYLKNPDLDFSVFRDPLMCELYKTFGVADSMGRGFDHFRKYRDENGHDFVKFVTTDINCKIILKFRSLESNINTNQTDPKGDLLNQNSLSITKKETISLTSKLGIFNDIFLGREQELENIHNILETSQAVLVKGIGGIGKSSLVSKYISKYKKDYSYCAFIVVEDNIKANFSAKLRSSLELKSNSLEYSYREAINNLSKIEGKKLLVIDDVRNYKKQKDEIENIIDLTQHNWDIIFTSRSLIPKIATYSLHTLKAEVGRELFSKYYKPQYNNLKNEHLHETIIEKILSFVDYHPLFIELITKTLNSLQIDLSDIHRKIEDGSFLELKFIDEISGLTENINDYLKEFFSMQNLNYEFELILKKLALLPSIELDITFLAKIINDSDLKSKLNFLVSRGWIMQHNNHYKLHQIIKEYIVSNHLPSFAEIEDVIDLYNKSFNTESSKLYHRDETIYFDSIVRILKEIKTVNEKRFIYYHHVGEIYMYVGKYLKALHAYTLAFEDAVELYGEESNEALLCLEKKAKAHSDLGNYNETLNIYENYLKVKTRKYPEHKLDIAAANSNIASAYIHINKIPMAQMYQDRAIKELRELNKEDSLEMSSCYNNYGLLYQKKGEYLKAIDSINESIRISLMHEESIDKVARKYENLAFLYSQVNNRSKTLELFEKSFNIKKELYDLEHPEIALSYYYLAYIFYSYKECYKSQYYAEKAVYIFSKSTSFIHPLLADTREVISNSNRMIKKSEKATLKNKKRFISDTKEFEIIY